MYNRIFYHLNTSHGLTDNYVRSMTVDKNGFLWVGTGEGLNIFNGRNVQKFLARDIPALRYDYINQLVCDTVNEIWALTAFGNVTQIDMQRTFRHIGLFSNGNFIPTKSIVQNDAGTIYLFTDSGFFRYKNIGAAKNKDDSLAIDSFEKVIIQNFSSQQVPALAKWVALAGNRMAVWAKGVLQILNFDKRIVERTFSVNPLTLLTAYDANALLVRAGNEGFGKLDIISGRITQLSQHLKDQRDLPLRAEVTNAISISPGRWMFTTNGDGLYMWLENAEKLINFRHQGSDPGTIVNNQLRELAVAPGGWLFAGGIPNGISYADMNGTVGTKEVFSDGKGQTYNGFIGHVNTLNGIEWYLTGAHHVIEWNSNTDAVRFLDYKKEVPGLKAKEKETYCTAFDGNGRLWIANDGVGLFVYDLKNESSKLHPGISDSIGIERIGRINHMAHNPDGYMYLCTRKGIAFIREKTFQQESIYTTLSDSLKGKYCIRSWREGDENIWVATVRYGLYCYHIPTGKVKKMDINNGLPSNNTYAMYRDRWYRFYVGTEEGLAVVAPDGKLKVFTTSEGLLNKRIEATLPDPKGRIWLGNDVGLACYDPVKQTIKAFDERYGLSVQGFRINSYAVSPTGMMAWGTERGLQFFNPDTLYNMPLRVRAMITRMESRSIATTLTKNEHFVMQPNDNFVSFQFNSIEYSPRLQSFFRYKLDGIDTGWIKVFEQFSARYTLLPPGSYTFRLQVSHNGNDWTDADNSVSFYIKMYWYEHPVIKLLAAALLAAVVFYGWTIYRRRQAAQRDELETEGIINYFASRINTHQTIEDILWDVARNCISRLHFEDCVIYLLDEERNILVQKAAFGPKGDDTLSIKSPIEIPVGKGIVGSVAQSGKAELIANTAADPRYIVDDQTRLSELAVPLIIDGKVIGVIDSENSKRNFFTPNHLRILNTVAVLCANQIQRARAEHDKQQAIVEGIMNKQQAAEYRLQSLRLQMNPHFLFNALNSIQQMILANEELVATRYLSRFSKLLRAVLVHSEEETVSLQQEIDILKLYIDLEAVRFKESFSYSIDCDPSIDVEEVRIPTLLVQPFVENAIWHGLMHKDGDKRLTISFTEKDNMIICTVEDNGVGRSHSALLKANVSGKGHTSKGIQVSTERLKKMEQTHGIPGSLIIEDLVNTDQSPAGTRVRISFPN